MSKMPPCAGPDSCAREQSADAQMCRRPGLFRDQRIRRFLNAVVHELIRARRAFDQFQTNRLPQIGVDLFLGSSPTSGDSIAIVGGVAETRQLL